MTTLNSATPIRTHTLPRRWLRWTLALALVLGLHFFAGVWVIRATRLSDSDTDPTRVPVQVALLKAQAVTDVATGKPASAGAQSAAGNAGASAGAGSSRGTNSTIHTDALQGTLIADTPPALPRAESHAPVPAERAQTTSPRATPSSANEAAAHNPSRKGAAPREAHPARESSARESIANASKPASTMPEKHRSIPATDAGSNHADTRDAASSVVASATHLPAQSSGASSGASTADAAADASPKPASESGSTSVNANTSASNAASAPAITTASTPTTAGAPGGNGHLGAAGQAAQGDESVGPGVAAHAAHAQGGERFSLPPSNDLRYDSFYNGVQNPTGTIHWTTDGSTYRMVVSIPLPFVGTYSYTSEGRVDAFGLAPLTYTEQRGRRGTDVTTFNRDDAGSRPHVSFTRTNANVDLPSGAQDRFSMFMQLSSLVRGNPSRYTPGVTREFFVLDNDSGENWPIETVGDETVRTHSGFVPARHFTRLPRHDGDRRKVDVWLAPSLGWLPIQFLQTEPDGTQIELRFAGAIPMPSNVSSAISPDVSSSSSPASESPPSNAASSANDVSNGASALHPAEPERTNP